MPLKWSVRSQVWALYFAILDGVPLLAAPIHGRRWSRQTTCEQPSTDAEYAGRENAERENITRKSRPVMLNVKSPAWKIAGPELYRWRQWWNERQLYWHLPVEDQSNKKSAEHKTIYRIYIFGLLLCRSFLRIGLCGWVEFRFILMSLIQFNAI